MCLELNQGCHEQMTGSKRLALQQGGREKGESKGVGNVPEVGGKRESASSLGEVPDQNDQAGKCST